MTTVTHDIILQLIQSSKAVSTSKAINILDYGCGDGSLYELLRTVYPNLGYFGMDVSNTTIAAAKRKYHSQTFSVISDPDNLNLGKPNSYDVICAVGVLQYMSHTQQKEFITRSYRSLKKGGHLIISALTDHRLYKVLDLYQLVIPHGSVTRTQLVQLIHQAGFSIPIQFEKGILFTPVFSHIACLFFDALDVIVHGKSGSIGPCGTTVRTYAEPFIRVEYSLPIDYGYTLFISAQK